MLLSFISKLIQIHGGHILNVLNSIRSNLDINLIYLKKKYIDYFYLSLYLSLFHIYSTSSTSPLVPPEEHEESQYNHYISEVRNFRMHLEAHEEHLIRKIRTPLDRDDLEQSQLRISEQEVRTSTAKYTKYTNTQIHQINNGSNFVFVPLMYL